MNIFDKETVSRRQNKVAAALNPLLQNGDCVLVFCGRPLPKPGGLDQTYSFLPHPTYFWLTGLRRAEGVIAYSKEQGWTEFIKPISREEKIWENADAVSPEGRDVATLSEFLKAQKFQRIFALGQISASEASLASPGDENLKIEIQRAVDAVRRMKDEAEVQLIRKIAAIAHKGYQKIQAVLRPGITEREIQIEYEAEVQRQGALGLPYETIVGSGLNSAVLHAIPTLRKVQDQEMVLVDAGAEIFDYCVDITRVYSSSGKFTSQQQALYDLVCRAQKAGIEKAQIGVQWHEVHRRAAEVIAEGLKDLKILKGSTTSLLESGAISVFFPHGVGHLVGLRVRDVGPIFNSKPQKHCGVSLRVDLPLEENHLVTVEPGCYFIAALLGDSEIRGKYQDFINWSEAEKWVGIGGVRIEDDILITGSGPQNLTEIVEK